MTTPMPITAAQQILGELNLQASAGKYQHPDDAKALANVKDWRIRRRILIERAIVRKLVSDLIAAGCAVTVDYGDGQYGVKKSTSLTEVMGHVGACDEEWLRVWKLEGGPTRSPWTKLGTIFLVFGNDGWDVIADHSTGEAFEALMAGANDLTDKLGDLL